MKSLFCQPLQTNSEFQNEHYSTYFDCRCPFCHLYILPQRYRCFYSFQKILALENLVDFQNARINSIEKSSKELTNLLIEKTARIEYIEAIMLQQHKEAKQFVTEEVVSKENNYTNQAIKYTENTNIYEGKKDAYENVIDRQGISFFPQIL